MLHLPKHIHWEANPFVQFPLFWDVERVDIRDRKSLFRASTQVSEMSLQESSVQSWRKQWALGVLRLCFPATGIGLQHCHITPMGHIQVPLFGLLLQCYNELRLSYDKWCLSDTKKRGSDRIMGLRGSAGECLKGPLTLTFQRVAANEGIWFWPGKESSAWDTERYSNSTHHILFDQFYFYIR